MKTIIAMLIAGVFLGAGPAFSAAETAGGNKESTRSGGKSADADAGGVPPEAEQGDKAEAAPQYGLVKGYRGTTLPVGGDQALYLKKGDRVDVLVTFDAKTQDKGKQERKEKITATILQNVVVLNVRRPEKVDDLGAVELLLNPVEAQYAALSIAQGDIHIVLRAAGDVELHPMEMASFRKLIQ